MSWLKFARVLEIKCAVNTDNPLLKLNLQPLTQEVKQFLFLHGLPGVDLGGRRIIKKKKMSEFDVLNCQTLEYQHVTHGTVIIVT